ncbi:unnamed protein product [Rotaria sordida]|uniref:Uncharacterized protein n=1 Tax=Rotaria sordida TaxID=392033 RepID=A0A818FW84_9BILA|nr:unnamed protein product [Rotaria sordida]CAF3482022.1 unnamed protein product [Rotaria sordida]CAF3770924.1 unnamed protein product [Rotaria sordida]
MSLSSFNNKIIELGKSVKRSKVRSIRKLTRQIEYERKKNPNGERTTRKVKRIIEEIHHIRKLPVKDVILFAMENEGNIAEILQKFKPNSDDIKQHALIRLATEKSLQSDIISLKTNDDYAKSWQQLLIMYRSRYEKRLVWKEKSEDFKKIEQALVDQQKELEEIEQNLPKPLEIKKKKEKKKSSIKRSKQAVVCVLDLENKTAEPFGNHTIDEDDDNDENEEKQSEKSEKIEIESNLSPSSSSSITTTTTTTTTVNDPFFLNSQHQITYQKRTSRNKNETDLDDKSFIEHSYFVDALSSSSNRRDGRGDLAKKKWAHLSLPNRPRPSSKISSSSSSSNEKFNGLTNNHKSKEQNSNSTSLHPSWEASRQAKSQYCIQKSQAKKIVFNNSDDENS